MGLLGREMPRGGPRQLSTMVPLCTSSRRPQLCPWDPCGIWLVASYLPGPALQPGGPAHLLFPTS